MAIQTALQLTTEIAPRLAIQVVCSSGENNGISNGDYRISNADSNRIVLLTHGYDKIQPWSRTPVEIAGCNVLVSLHDRCVKYAARSESREETQVAPGGS